MRRRAAQQNSETLERVKGRRATSMLYNTRPLMLRLIPLVASTVLFGCDAGVTGSYALVSWDGQPLPYSFELFGTVTVASGALTLRDSTYEINFVLAEGDSMGDRGTFTLDQSNTLCLTSLESWPSGDPPPPPPPPGDRSTPDRTPRADVQQLRPAPEPTPECIAVWQGDRITATDSDVTLVFER